MPATLHVDAPSPQIDWATGEIALLTQAQPWPSGQRSRRAGVSSFGVSGTNAHLIIEEAPAVVMSERSPVDDALAAAALAEQPVVVPWVLSAKTEGALVAGAARLAARVRADACVGRGGCGVVAGDGARTVCASRGRDRG